MAPQPELLAYWQSLAQKHNLHANTVFHAHVVCATWNDALREWELVVEDVTTGIRTVTTARAVVSATGILSEPFVPEILGMRRFRGPLFHSARWNHSVYTRGKRIAVIGNGASASVTAFRLLRGDRSAHFTQCAVCSLPRLRSHHSRCPYLSHA